MRTHAISPLFFLAAALLACGCAGRARRAKPEGYVFSRVPLARVGRFEFELSPGETVRFATRNPSRGLVPMLHLWDDAQKLEVARGLGSSFLASELTYQNPDRARRRFTLILRTLGDLGGTVDLERNGARFASRIALDGARLGVRGAAGFVYQVAASPGAPATAQLYAFDADDRLVAFDDHSGPLGLPRIESSAAVRTLVLGAPSAEAAPVGTLRVYLNDLAQDHDGDGLGQMLERALGSCDAPNEPGCKRSALAPYYRALPHATRDSDRDGIADGDELFGVGAPRHLDLPRFGADPRHKDVFVEVDREARVEGAGLSESDAAAIAALFAAGSAQELRNPDQKPGVHVHLDLGFAPSDPRHLGLFGDFGGSNVAAGANYRSARKSDFTPGREGYFRYAFLTRSGTGQASGDAFTVNRDFHRVPIFAHELGHTLGLAHHGHDRWGRANCKPNYLSIMNYLYQNREEVGFSRGASAVLNPARVFESEPVDARAAEAYSAPPLELELIDGAVDWNRDGVIEREPVRAGLQWATYKSCGAAERGLDVLAQGELAHTSPALVATPGQLHAFWLDAQGQLWLRSGASSGPDADGSCPNGDATPERCMNFGSPVRVGPWSGLREIALAKVAGTDAQLVLAYSDARAAVHVAWLELARAEVKVLGDRALPAAQSGHALGLALTPALHLMWRDAASGVLQLARAQSPEGPFERVRVLDARAQPIVSALGPALAALPTGELCGVFPDADAYIRFYCYDAARARWANLSRAAFYAGLGPHTSGAVALAFHRYRAADGTLLDRTRGALYLSFTEPESQDARDPDNPHFLISRALSARAGAFQAIDFRWRGSVINQWTKVVHGTALALYEDESLSALKALMLTDMKKTGTRIEFLPLADGAYDEDFGSGDDFEVMERGICLGIRSPLECGDEKTGAY